MSSFTIVSAVLKAQAGKVRQKFRTEPDRIDKNLPLNIRIGGMVGCDSVPFILAENAGSVVKALTSERLVTAYEAIPYVGGVTMHLFYLDGDGEYIVRIITNRDGSIAQDAGILLCQQLEEVEPSTPESWNEWIGNPKDAEEPHRIGWEDYCLGEDEDPHYLRTVDCVIVNQKPDEDECYLQTPQIKPIKLTGKFYTEQNVTDSAIRMPRKMMLYSRALKKDGDTTASDLAEHCMVSSVEGEYGGYIHAVVGIPISTENLTII